MTTRPSSQSSPLPSPFSALPGSSSPASSSMSSEACSDDDVPVFFGAHQPEEASLYAKYASSFSSPAPDSSHRRSTRINQLAKRDSRELLRRKSLLRSVSKNDESERSTINAKDKAWHGGFFEKLRDAADVDSDEDEEGISPVPAHHQTPSRAVQSEESSDLTMMFSTFRLVEVMRSPDCEEQVTSSDSETSDGESSKASSSSYGGQSDKENTIVPVYEDTDDEDEEMVGGMVEGTVTLGFHKALEAQDELAELDMGGLRLSDFADPEADSSDHRDDLIRRSSIDLGESSGTDDEDEWASGTRPPMASPTVTDVSSTPLFVTDRICAAANPLCEEEDHTIRPGPPTQLSSAGTDTSSPPDLDSPLPMARGGPVIIPKIAAHHLSIRAETGSPFRSLPTPPREESPHLTPDTLCAEQDVNLPECPLDSPGPKESTMPFAASTPRQLAPLASLVRPDAATRAPLPPKLLKPLVQPLMQSIAPVPASADRTKPRMPANSPEKSAARAAIRGQLDAVFTGRLAAMGPPQRSVSSSSASSNSSGASATGRPKSEMKSGLTSTVGSAVRHPLRKPTPPNRVTTAMAHRPPPAPASLASSTASTLPRPRSTFAKPAVPAARSALAPRTHFPQAQPVPRATATSGSDRYARHALKTIVKPNVPPIKISPLAIQTANPLKRPLPVSQSAAPRLAISASASSRPTLGLPSRLVRDGPNGPTMEMMSFSIGGGGGGGEGPLAGGATRVVGAFKSPARPTAKRSFCSGPATPGSVRNGKLGLGTPLRNAGTPPRPTPRPIIVMAASETSKQDVSLVEPSTSSGPPATATRSAETARGSSEDRDSVSSQLAPPSSSDLQSSPGRSSPTRSQSQSTPVSHRPKRAVRPPPVPAPRARKAPTTVASIAPNLSEKELKKTTERNTAKNQVYLCAIDRQIVRKTGERPPSPTSKIRTTADKEEEGKKKARGERYKRRERAESADTDGEGGSEAGPIVERIEWKVAAGDEGEWVTPARPAKRAKVEDERESKAVKWDKGLVVIRDDGRPISREDSRESMQQAPKKSAIKDSRVELDQHGNVRGESRNDEKLKRQRIVVTAIFYDGENPAPITYPTLDTPVATNTKGRKK